MADEEKGLRKALTGEHWKGLTPSMLLLQSIVIGVCGWSLIYGFAETKSHISTKLNSIIDTVAVNSEAIRTTTSILHSLDKRLTAREADILTMSDGREIQNQILELQASLTKVVSQVPPPWFYEKVDRLDHTVSEMKTRLEYQKR